jgi:hypothetical protein
MNRRDFLKVSSLSSAALFVQVSPLLSKSKYLQADLLKVDGVLFRSAHGGEIHTSHDVGRTWQLHTRLGSEYAITGLYSDWWQQLHAQVAFAGHSFDLVLGKDKKYWRTV